MLQTTATPLPAGQELESKLIARAAAGDHTAFDAEAEDAVQEG